MRKRAAKEATPSPPPQTLHSNQTRNKITATINRNCLQERPTEKSIEAARNRAKPIVPSTLQRIFCGQNKTSLPPRRRRPTRAEARTGGRGGTGSRLAPAQRRLRNQKMKASLKEKTPLQASRRLTQGSLLLTPCSPLEKPRRFAAPAPPGSPAPAPVPSRSCSLSPTHKNLPPLLLLPLAYAQTLPLRFTSPAGLKPSDLLLYLPLLFAAPAPLLRSNLPLALLPLAAPAPLLLYLPLLFTTPAPLLKLNLHNS